MAMKTKCANPACRRMKSVHLYACYTCWYKLPSELRSRIYDAYNTGGAIGNPAWEAADKEATAWYKENAA